MTNSSDDLEEFLTQLHVWSRNQLARLDDGKPGRRAGKERLSREYIALDLLQSVFSAYEASAPSERVLNALPVAAWREDTVPVPRAWVRALADAWGRYKAAQSENGGRTLGECFGIEGGAGRSPTAKTERTRAKNQRMSNKASVLILDGLTHEAAFALVAGEENCSEHAVKAAHDKFGQPFMPTYRTALEREGKNLD
jgi:hypothetical protein